MFSKSNFREIVYHRRVTWKIFNFFKSPVSNDEIIESPEFVINFPEPTKWRLTVEVEKQFSDIGTVTVIRLIRSPSCTSTELPNLKVRLDAIYSNKTLPSDFAGTQKELPAGIYRKIYRHITSYEKTPFTDSSTLTVTCDFLVDDDVYFQDSEIDKDLKDLSNDLKDFYRAGILTNLDLKVGYENVSVHRAILKARAPYVAGKLSEDPTLRQIDLTDFGHTPHIKGLITYWYCGDFNEIPRTTCSSTSNFVRIMGQYDILPFVHYKNDINLYTTFVTSPSSVSWVIKDSKFCEELKNLQNGVFPEYTLTRQSWKLRFFSRGDAVNTGEADYISMCVEYLGETTEVKPVFYLEIFFKDGAGNEYGCKKTISWLYPDEKYVFPNFMSHNEFSGLQEVLLRDDTFRIGCCIIYRTGDVESHARIPLDPEDETVQHSFAVLSNALKNLFQSGDLSNVTLTARGRIFRVHREILAARSGYFRSLFIERFNTADNTYMEVNEADPDELDMILKYMYYAEKIELNLERALKLCPIFHSFEMQHLVNLCWDYLRSHLTVDNAIDIIELASRCNYVSLMTAAREIIRANCNRIYNTERWRRLVKENFVVVREIVYGKASRSK